MPADPFRQLGGGGLAEGQAGDRIDGDGPPFPAGQWPGPPGDPQGLRGVREGARAASRWAACPSLEE
ncbi:MAG: hypothetical protein ACXVX7_07180 [Mycobacterium sp.]